MGTSLAAQAIYGLFFTVSYVKSNQFNLALFLILLLFLWITLFYGLGPPMSPELLRAFKKSNQSSLIAATTQTSSHSRWIEALIFMRSVRQLHHGVFLVRPLVVVEGDSH